MSNAQPTNAGLRSPVIDEPSHLVEKLPNLIGKQESDVFGSTHQRGSDGAPAQDMNATLGGNFPEGMFKKLSVEAAITNSP